jgi:ribosomal protein S7
LLKKRLKIPKAYSESVYRRRTNNAMAQGKISKAQSIIYKNTPQKTTD